MDTGINKEILKLKTLDCEYVIKYFDSFNDYSQTHIVFEYHEVILAFFNSIY